MMRLKTISILGERITQPDQYPFNIPTIASLKTLEITSPICFFVGENGTGKSTLLEAIAAHYGFGLEAETAISPRGQPIASPGLNRWSKL
jgi:predicted ATPase